MAVDKEESIKLPEKHSKLQRFKETKGTETRKCTRFRLKIVKEFGTEYVSKTIKWKILESRESDGSSSRFFVWGAFESEENGGQNPNKLFFVKDYTKILPAFAELVVLVRKLFPVDRYHELHWVTYHLFIDQTFKRGAIDLMRPMSQLELRGLDTF